MDPWLDTGTMAREGVSVLYWTNNPLTPELLGGYSPGLLPVSRPTRGVEVDRVCVPPMPSIEVPLDAGTVLHLRDIGSLYSSLLEQFSSEARLCVLVIDPVQPDAMPAAVTLLHAYFAKCTKRQLYERASKLLVCYTPVSLAAQFYSETAVAQKKSPRGVLGQTPSPSATHLHSAADILAQAQAQASAFQEGLHLVTASFDTGLRVPWLFVDAVTMLGFPALFHSIGAALRQHPGAAAGERGEGVDVTASEFFSSSSAPSAASAAKDALPGTGGSARGTPATAVATVVVPRDRQGPELPSPVFNSLFPSDPAAFSLSQVDTLSLHPQQAQDLDRAAEDCFNFVFAEYGQEGVGAPVAHTDIPSLPE
ncbi:hypothetical protein KIPB_005344 [Kipferlia bialata]|uniref:Uncharacterized protein n=1 Tax=Kipferlia bialata TaxID=797122 RepID=A0A9K3GIG4_9EUKA|nr:hypothetical protein KIPB_005344 [Kipferlia bialata]|eukprot:g5344.t1